MPFEPEPRDTVASRWEEHDACGVALMADVAGRPSHDVLARTLEALRRLTHRGAVDDRGRSADGAGVLTGIPWPMFFDELPRSFRRPGAPRIAGMCALAGDQSERARRAATSALERAGWRRVTWRPVPMQPAALGTQASEAPHFFQCFAVAGRAVPQSPFRTRLLIETRWRQLGLDRSSIFSLSDRTLVHKALVSPEALPRLFPDLVDPRFATPFAIVHQRFSTNTLARWDLAQPFRTLAHNGEINTIRGNRLWMAARQADSDAIAALAPGSDSVVRCTGSDSETLDDAIELLRETGCSTPEALARLLPIAWEHDLTLSPAERDFYRYHSCFAEPWEGPAAIAFADGRFVGVVVDRNGFRPMRTLVTTDNMVYAASEAGVFDVAPAQVRSRGRLGPGEMLVVDLERRLVRQGTFVRHGWRSAPAQNLAQLLHRLDDTLAPAGDAIAPADLVRWHHRFGWTREEIDIVVKPLACEGYEAVGSMGDDTGLAALSSRPRPLADYFRQRFAQVTNPPIDHVREGSVMSLRTLLGRRGSWFGEGPAPLLLELDSPVLGAGQFAALRQRADVRATTLRASFDPAGGAHGLRQALDHLQASACALVANGTRLIVLSDRCGDDPAEAPLPSLLATAAVDQALRDAGLRLRASIVVESGEVRDTHQFATLCGFGASAVYPYLLYATAAAVADDAAGVERCRAALEQGLLKIMSKMGVCTFEAYVGGRLFDVMGVDGAMVDLYFQGCSGLRGHVGLETIAGHVAARHNAAAQTLLPMLSHPGFHTFRRDGDHHGFNPTVVKRLHQASAHDGSEAYRAFAELIEARPVVAPRDLLEFVSREPVGIGEVEPIDSICRRFFVSAMSLGALSPEAHRTLAAAMNMIGGRSNSGEGGEEPERHLLGRASARSATKQVASARFGVTPAYLIRSTELQIKMAQGSKPGEGGQLPGAKVDDFIARLRYAQPGMALISPPPHHDIYSIEDLAQLIVDLRTFHGRARINVKLVSQPGIGVIAAGVVKAGADAIQISGQDGGTGASPRGSIKHAGAPWELGLSEAHRTLSANGLRQRVVLQTDGGLQTGRDIAIAAVLGADEFGFGTAALVALGCVMARQCHLNTCPVGIASQRPDLRSRFQGTPEMVVSYLKLVAQHTREILASLGLRRLDELIGRADLLEARESGPAPLDLTPLLVRTPALPKARRTRRRETGDLNRALARAARGRLGTAPVSFLGTVRNTDRTVGAELAGRLAARSGDAGTAHAPLEVRLTGSAGQSFWAFALPGMHVRLEGQANDGVGKGMHGGEITIRPPSDETDRAPVLVGNAALYGATGGRLFIAGRVGERFAVRNSGAWAVVEGTGDHACEYMTGGAVLILGSTGRNMAAGMTGGIAYVFDEGSEAPARINGDSVDVRRGLGRDEAWVRAWLAEHHERTGSTVAARLLRNWSEARGQFWTIVPRTEARARAYPGAERERESIPARG